MKNRFRYSVFYFLYKLIYYISETYRVWARFGWLFPVFCGSCSFSSTEVARLRRNLGEVFRGGIPTLLPRISRVMMMMALLSERRSKRTLKETSVSSTNTWNFTTKLTDSVAKSTLLVTKISSLRSAGGHPFFQVRRCCLFFSISPFRFVGWWVSGTLDSNCFFSRRVEIGQRYGVY